MHTRVDILLIANIEQNVRGNAYNWSNIEIIWELSLKASILFVKSLNSSILHTQWKEACATPTFKKGDRCVVSNYRKISLIPPVVEIHH